MRAQDPSGPTGIKARRLGRTDLRLSSIGFGGGPIGWLAAENARHVAQLTLEAAWSAGIRFFDTAPYYGHGASELRIGEFLRGKDRSGFVLSTKVGRLIRPASSGGASPPEVMFDYSRDGALRSIEESLARLGLDRVDIALIHDIDGWTHGAAQKNRFAEAIDGAYRALCDLKAQGVVNAIGLGVNEWRVCREFSVQVPIDCFLLAGRVSLLEHEAAEEFLPSCAEAGIGVIIGGPFNSGILASGSAGIPQYNYGPAPESILARVRRMEAACASYGIPLAAAALAHPLRQPAVASVIPGLASAAEAAMLTANLRLSIPDGLWKSLDGL